MSYINLNPGSCQACYKCIRECPVKSIAFKDDKATIIENECIICGKCIEVCPQNAKFIQSELSQVQVLIGSGKKVIASLAPSYKAWFKDSFEELYQKFCSVGFYSVEETAIGASFVNHEYLKIMKSRTMPIMITSACPSVVMLVERYYPCLIPLLTPTLSPMMAHGKLIKEVEPDAYVVFIGPCISKKYEPSDAFAQGYIDNVLTFEEVEGWLKKEIAAKKSSLEKKLEQKQHIQGLRDSATRIYPRSKGIIESMETIAPLEGYLPIAIDGARDCINMFEYLKNCIDTDSMPNENLFIEANICKGACMNGPLFKIHKKQTLISSQRVTKKKEAQDSQPTKSSVIRHINLDRSYLDRSKKVIEPTEDDLVNILTQMGKHRHEDELNCGTCGYPTCRSKAEAVFYGKADIRMCLPFFRKKAENFSNVIIEHSPNGIVALDKDHYIVDINPRAAEIYKVDPVDIVGGIIPELYDDDSFDRAKTTGLPIRENLKLKILDMEIYIEKSMVYIEEHDTFVAFIKDTSAEELHKQQILKMRMHTASVTQNVIEKQMRVVQEIASLLGETTAETKLALNNLKETILSD